MIQGELNLDATVFSSAFIAITPHQVMRQKSCDPVVRFRTIAHCRERELFRNRFGLG